MGIGTKIWYDMQNAAKQGMFDVEAEAMVERRKATDADYDEKYRQMYLDSAKRELVAKYAKEQIMEEAEDLFSRSIDIFNGDEQLAQEAFLNALTKTHRTIQANFWNGIFNMAKKYSELPDHYFDPRNIYSKALCKEMTE